MFFSPILGFFLQNTAFSCIISCGETDKGSGYVTFVKRLKNLTFKKAVKKLLRFAKKNAVMFVAFIAAVVTSFFIPIDKEYLNYLTQER